jgi:hypothetical protein
MIETKQDASRLRQRLREIPAELSEALEGVLKQRVVLRGYVYRSRSGLNCLHRFHDPDRPTARQRRARIGAETSALKGLGKEQVLRQALAALPEGVPTRYVRGDSALYDQKLLGALEADGIGFGISAEVGQALLNWQRQRCGTVEWAHDVLKNDFAARVLPSGRFGANAAWYRFSPSHGDDAPYSRTRGRAAGL